MSTVTTRREAVSAALVDDPATAFFAIRDIHAYYGESYIVQGVTLDIRKGEVLALLGRNGAGKSSTLRAIARLDQPELRAGEIWLEGKPIHGMKSGRPRAPASSSCRRTAAIIPGLTVEENLFLARDRAGARLGAGADHAHFPRLAERRGAGGHHAVRRRAADAGGGARPGARRQAAAARRTHMRGWRRCIVLRRTRASVHDLRKLGITTIIVEQNAVAALRLADRAVILDSGELVFAGGAAELLDNPGLRNEYLAI